MMGNCRHLVSVEEVTQIDRCKQSYILVVGKRILQTLVVVQFEEAVAQVSLGMLVEADMMVEKGEHVSWLVYLNQNQIF